MTKQQWADFETIGKYEKRVEFLLFKLTEPKQAAPLLSAYFPQYMDAQFVPLEEQAAVLRELRGEVRALELLGDELYFATRGKAAKTTTYMYAICFLQGALDETPRAEGAESKPPYVTWGDFKRELSELVQTMARRVVEEGK